MADITAHIDRPSNVIDGVTWTLRHSGQKRAYGDSYYEYAVSSDLPASEVERICSERIHKAIPLARWRDDNRSTPTASNYFRAHYDFTSLGEGKYFYRVTFPYTD